MVVVPVLDRYQKMNQLFFGPEAISCFNENLFGSWKRSGLLLEGDDSKNKNAQKKSSFKHNPLQKVFSFVMRVPFVFPCTILKIRNTCEENLFDRTEIKTAENRKESVPYLVFPLGLTRTLLRTLFAEVFAVPVQRVVPLHFYLDRLLVGPPWDPRQQAEIYRK